jgi:hypothetical protein
MSNLPEMVAKANQSRARDLAAACRLGWRHSSFGGPGSVVWTMA